MNVDKSKKRKSIMGPDGISPASAGPNGQTPASASESTPNRRESIAAAAPAPSHRESIGAEKPTPADKKKGAQQVERRKLTEQEEQVYGVSHHDRLGSGPTFRTEKVNKLFSHKSGQQQMRITNALNELDVPSRLVMPTASVTAQFEQLLHAVNALVDLRKVSDKLDAEIKIEEAKKAERLKAKGVLAGTDGASDEPPPETTVQEQNSDEAAKAAPAATEGSSQPTKDDQQQGGNAETEGGGSATGGDAAPPVEVKKEEVHKEKTPRPGSSGGHKRSASVLSTTSEKSTKRLRK
jgi:DNA methyltransferase 1-associated protein 1